MSAQPFQGDTAAGVKEGLLVAAPGRLLEVGQGRPVPAQFQVGQEVKLTVSVQADGSFLVQGLSQDGDSQEANNPDDQQGCQDDGPGNSCGADSSSGDSNSGGSNSGQDSSGSNTSGSDG